MMYLLCGDLHFRYTIPKCRTDNFIQTQIDRMKWLREIQEKHRAKILCVGDVTHKAREEKQNELMVMLLEHFPEMDGLAGNHDLLNHSMRKLYKSCLGALIKSGKYNLLPSNNYWCYEDSNDLIYPFHFGEEIKTAELTAELGKTIALWHEYVSIAKDKNIKGSLAKNILKNNNYDLIVTGDNHQTFTLDYEGKTLINVGSLFRQTAEQIDHKPCVFIYDSDTGEYFQEFAPIKKNVISSKHLDEQKERDADLDSFVSSVKSVQEIGLSFTKNMKKHIVLNNISKPVEAEIIWAMETQPN